MKANRIIGTKGLSRFAWLEERRKGIGGSDAAIVTGNSPWNTRLNLWREKVGLIDEKQPDNLAMKMGRILEPTVIELFKETTGKSVQRVRAVLQSRENPFLIGNLDARVRNENALLEVKTSASQDPWIDGGIPPAYFDQCQHLMALGHFDRAYLAVLVQGRSFYWMAVERDEHYISWLIEEERKFWALVTSRTPPEPTPEEALRQLQLDYPASKSGLAINLDGVNAERLLVVKRTLEGLEAEEERLRVELLQEMQDAELGLYKGTEGIVKVTWRVADGRVSFDSDRFKKEHPELWPQYQRQGESKRMPRFYINSAA
jgi:putative phage-type endonuclease